MIPGYIGLSICVAVQVVYQVAADDRGIQELFVDQGSDAILPCGDAEEPVKNVQWVHQGNRTHHQVLADGQLVLWNASAADAGLYECARENEPGWLDRVNVTVRTVPPPLVNVSVHASTILALVLWGVAGDGGLPITDFTAQYRAAPAEPWRPISPNHISPNSRQIDVYHLEPNSSYYFRVWATNALGPGQPVEVAATTLYSDQDAELYRRFLADAESFNPRWWLAAVCVVGGTLAVLAVSLALVLWRDLRADMGGVDGIELVPNIIVNPGFASGPAPNRPGSIIRSSERPGPGQPRKV